MIVVDVIVIAVLVVALLTGLGVGLFASLGWWAGLIAGGFAAPWVAPWVSALIPHPAWRGAAVIGTVVALLIVGAGIGTAIGALLRRGADRMRLRVLERLLGGAFGLVAAAVVATMAGSALVSAGIPLISSTVASSSVLRTIERITPPPVSEAIARLQGIVAEDALPALGGVLDADIAYPEPELDTDDPALAAAAASVARISGVAYACGTGTTGSGFVAAEDLLVTNAHVVAGLESVIVDLPDGPAVDGRVVYFDPIDDLALIAADVPAPPLAIADPLVPGDDAAVLGYPHGGPLAVGAAAVMTVGPVTVHDIYGDSATPRETYALAAEVEPGNSGGPMLTSAGEVAGVVFARDSERAGVGYAMTTAELLPALEAADATSDPVPTGSCAG